jgi:hypothetical protein
MATGVLEFPHTKKAWLRRHLRPLGVFFIDPMAVQLSSLPQESTVGDAVAGSGGQRQGLATLFQRQWRLVAQSHCRSILQDT